MYKNSLFHQIVDEEVEKSRDSLNITKVEHFDDSVQIWFRHNRKKSGEWPTQIYYNNDTGEVKCNGPYNRARILSIAFGVLRHLKELS